MPCRLHAGPPASPAASRLLPPWRAFCLSGWVTRLPPNLAVFMVPYGLAYAVCARVGALLGQQNPRGAKLAGALTGGQPPEIKSAARLPSLPAHCHSCLPCLLTPLLPAHPPRLQPRLAPPWAWVWCPWRRWRCCCCATAPPPCSPQTPPSSRPAPPSCCRWRRCC